jgi:hypothetical protein
MPTQPSPVSPQDGHEVQMTISQGQKAVPIDQLKGLSEKQREAILHGQPVSIDQLVSRYPEPLQTRATWLCPSCKAEIPVPYGSLRAYAEHLKATNEAIRMGAPVVLRIRAACRLRGA